MEKIINCLKQCILFKGFTEKEFQNLFGSMVYRVNKYAKKEVIALEESECNSIGIIISGGVEVKKIFATGKVVTLTRLSKGDIFGEVIVFSENREYPATVLASDVTEVLFISKDSILDFCSTNKIFLDNFLKLLSSKILMLNQKVKNLSFHTIRQKIANYLLTEVKKQKSLILKISISKNLLAEQLGMPRPSLSRELIKMREEKIIEFDRNVIKILDYEEMENSLFI